MQLKEQAGKEQEVIMAAQNMPEIRSKPSLLQKEVPTSSSENHSQELSQGLPSQNYRAQQQAMVKMTYLPASQEKKERPTPVSVPQFEQPPNRQKDSLLQQFGHQLVEQPSKPQVSQPEPTYLKQYK